jgi:hypothetical protein
MRARNKPRKRSPSPQAQKVRLMDFPVAGRNSKFSPRHLDGQIDFRAKPR